jgi:serine/threonine protein kinase
MVCFETAKDIRSDIRFGRVIGEGGFGTVRLGYYKNDAKKKVYAIKQINKTRANIDLNMMKREIN